MKKLISITTGLMITIILITSCNNQTEQTLPPGPPVMQQDTLIEPPEEKFLTNEQLQKTINQEIHRVIDLEDASIIETAAEVVEYTKLTITALLSDEYREAEKLLNKATATARLITMGGNENAEVISEVNIAIQDNVKDILSAIELKNQVDSLIHVGDFQKARYSLQKMTSEIEIVRESLSMPLYAKALEKAQKHMNYELYNDAARVLNEALNSRITEHRAIPLPIIKAERMLAEVKGKIAEANKHQEDINKLLDNAEYQIKFMEVLGYGKGNEMYTQLYNDIQIIRDKLYAGEAGEAEKHINTLIEKLDQLKTEVIQYKANTGSFSS